MFQNKKASLKEFTSRVKLGTMEYQNFQSLIVALQTHEQYKHEIKIKRLRKQLQILSKYNEQNENSENVVKLTKLMLTSVGIQIHIDNKYKNRLYKYKLILDVEYPFNRPQIHYLNSDHPMGKCKDLLGILLQEGKNWGPSLMLTIFLDRIEQISEAINQNIVLGDDRSGAVSLGTYHRYQIYSKMDLSQLGVVLFDKVNEYTWKYLIKSTYQRVIGLTDQNILIFQPENLGAGSLMKGKKQSSHQQVHPVNALEMAQQNNLRLLLWKPINQLLTVKASVNKDGKKFSLEITCKNDNFQGQQQNGNKRQKTLYFGGCDDVEKILRFLNPIEMIQRKVSEEYGNLDTDKMNKSDLSLLIKDYTQLIEHYSINDGNKVEKYIKQMKRLISKQYQVQMQQQKQKNAVEDKKIEQKKVGEQEATQTNLSNEQKLQQKKQTSKVTEDQLQKRSNSGGQENKKQDSDSQPKSQQEDENEQEVETNKSEQDQKSSVDDDQPKESSEIDQHVIK